jgi:hypothetical protein
MADRTLTFVLVLVAIVGSCRCHRTAEVRSETPARADASGAFYILPYVQNVTETGVTVLWWTEGVATPSRVEYGDGFLQHAAGVTEDVRSVGKTLHTAFISGLRPGTPCTYRVRHGDATSPESTFRTAVERSEGFRFAVLGDGRTDDDDVIARHRAITRLALSRAPAFAIHNGDMVATGEQDHWDRFWRRVVTPSDPTYPGVPFATSIPYYLVLGNHELLEGMTLHNFGFGSGNFDTAVARFQAYVEVPRNGSSTPRWEERYYSFRYGAASFIVLDTNNTSDDALDNHDYLPDGSTPDWEPGSEQHGWLVRQLEEANRTSVFTFVLMHPSPYSRGAHGDPDDGQSGWHVRALDPLFRQHGVDAVISSHDHVAERCMTGPPGFEARMDPADPTSLSYFVTGNAGHSTRRAARGWMEWMDVRDDDSAPFHSVYFYDWARSEHTSLLEVDIEPTSPPGRWRAVFRLVRDDGAIFDQFSIERDDPVRPPVPST